MLQGPAADGLTEEMTMSSPVQETMTAFPAEAAAPADVETDAASYGPDEENLVQAAQREAMLRLARAM
jgi:hypothetical protein